MYKLKYGNKYTQNEEEYNGTNVDNKSMLTSTLDFLDTQEEYFLDDNGCLPEDWAETIFWDVNKM